MIDKKDTDTLSRRDLLSVSSALFLSACGSNGEEPNGGGSCDPVDPGAQDWDGVFAHGVASGDPLPDSVILWTRVSPSTAATADVHYRVFRDPGLSDCAVGGTVTTDASKDFTVKVDVKGLEAGTTYYYRFYALGRESPVGRTRTAPTGAVDRLRFAVVSCSSLAHGYFHVYSRVAERADLDAIVHLGDYIYEYATGSYGSVRAYEPPNEIINLGDYRTRYAQYRRDEALQEAHRQHPMIAVWDDHEVADNSWKTGALNHDPATEGDYQVRRQNALQAYLEWMPIRGGEDGKIWRTLRYGDLAELVMLDTRLWGRDSVVDAVVGPLLPPDPSRSLLGDDQATWLEERLTSSTSQWKVVGQQVMISLLRIDASIAANPNDQWQGYTSSRTRFLEFVRDSGTKDVVVLTGDIHSSWASEVPLDPLVAGSYDPATSQGSILVEFVTPAVTSPGLSGFTSVIDAARPFNPGIKFVDLEKRGYIVLDVTAERTQAAWFWVDDIVSPTAGVESFAAAYSVAADTTRLTQDTAAAAPRSDAPALAG